MCEFEHITIKFGYCVCDVWNIEVKGSFLTDLMSCAGKGCICFLHSFKGKTIDRSYTETFFFNPEQS